MSNHPTFALAYDDYIQRSTYSESHPSHPTSINLFDATEIGHLDSLRTPQLSQCWGYSGASLGPPYVDLRLLWGDPSKPAEKLPVRIISLLDVRITFEASMVDQFLSFSLIDGASVYEELLEDLPVILSRYPSDDFTRHIHLILPADFDAHGVRLIYQGFGAVTIGQIWAGPLWLPSAGIQHDWECSIIDPGEMGISRGGQGYPRQRQRRRQLDMRLSHVPFEQAFGNSGNTVLDLQQIGYRVGTTTPIIAFPRTRDAAGNGDAHAIHRLGVYGHLAEPLRIRHVASDRFDTAIRVAELF